MLEEKVFHVNKKVDVGGKSISCQQKKLMLEENYFMPTKKVDVGGKSISFQQKKLMLDKKGISFRQKKS